MFNAEDNLENVCESSDEHIESQKNYNSNLENLPSLRYSFLDCPSGVSVKFFIVVA